MRMLFTWWLMHRTVSSETFFRTLVTSKAFRVISTACLVWISSKLLSIVLIIVLATKIVLLALLWRIKIHLTVEFMVELVIFIHVVSKSFISSSVNFSNIILLKRCYSWILRCLKRLFAKSTWLILLLSWPFNASGRPLLLLCRPLDSSHVWCRFIFILIILLWWPYHTLGVFLFVLSLILRQPSNASSTWSWSIFFISFSLVNFASKPLNSSTLFLLVHLIPVFIHENLLLLIWLALIMLDDMLMIHRLWRHRHYWHICYVILLIVSSRCTRGKLVLVP